MSTANEASTDVFVGSLPFTLSDSDLLELASEYGRVVRATIIIDRATGKSRGFGFLHMATDAGAATAIRGLEGRIVQGRRIVARPATPQGVR